MKHQVSWAQIAVPSVRPLPVRSSPAGAIFTLPPRRTRARTRREALLALGLYVLVAGAYLGRSAIRHPAAGTIGAGPDVQIFLWSLRWWPYALAHGIDPLVSHVVWSPYGSNVLWSSTVPLLSLLAAPVTLTFGPTVAWNLLCVLAPALSAWGAFLLCRELTRAFWPSVAGGLLFGFSSYELAESMAHLQLTAALLVPLAAMVAVRYLRGKMSRSGLAVRMATIAAAQFLISPEILATLVLSGGLTALAAAIIMPDLRRALREAVAWTARGLAGAAVTVAPVLISMLAHIPAGAMNPPGTYSADLLNLVVPTPITALGGSAALPIATRFSGNLAEQVAYLGLPLVLILVMAVWTDRRNPAVRLLAVVLCGAVVLSLGPRLCIAGRPTIWLPGALLARVPVLEDALPARLALYASLAAAILVALWLARPCSRTPGRWAAFTVVIVALAPTLSFCWQATPPAVAHDDLGRIIPVGATVVSLPFWAVHDRALYAQAAADMRFRLDDSWLQLVPRQLRNAAASRTLAGPRLTRAELPAFERAICTLRAGYALVWGDDPAYLAVLRLTPVHVDHMLVYRLPRWHCWRVP